MVIYDPIRNEKNFLDEFVSGLILNNHPIRLHKQFY